MTNGYNDTNDDILFIIDVFFHGFDKLLEVCSGNVVNSMLVNIIAIISYRNFNYFLTFFI